MSWEGFKQIEKVDDLSAADFEVVADEAGADSELASQLKAGIKAAKELIRSGAVGEGETYNVWISGHANKGNADSPGADNDRVSVTVAIGAYPGHSKQHPPEPANG